MKDINFLRATNSIEKMRTLESVTDLLERQKAAQESMKNSLEAASDRFMKGRGWFFSDYLCQTYMNFSKKYVLYEFYGTGPDFTLFEWNNLYNSNHIFFSFLAQIFFSNWNFLKSRIEIICFGKLNKLWCQSKFGWIRIIILKCSKSMFPKLFTANWPVNLTGE